jgi:hypothetical protein
MFCRKLTVAINWKGTLQVSVVATLLFYIPHNKCFNSILLFFKDITKQVFRILFVVHFFE